MPVAAVMTPIPRDPNRHPQPEAPQVRLGPTGIDDDTAVRLVDDISLFQVASVVLYKYLAHKAINAYIGVHGYNDQEVATATG